jgi:hypothetical protein
VEDHRLTEPASPGITAETEGGYGVALTDLTDEELQAVDPLPPEQRLVIYPFLDPLQGAERDMAVLVAFRGLVARGLVTPPTEAQVDVALSAGGETGSIEIGVDEAIAGIVGTRRSAPAVVCAQRTVARRSDYCYWYLVDDEAAMEEFVEPKGLHRFRALEARLVPAALYGYLNPDRVNGQDGDTFEESAEAAAGGRTPAAVLEDLGQAHAIGEFLVRSAEPDEHPTIVSVAASPDRLRLAEVRFGSGEPVRIREVAGATLLERIEAALRRG